MAMQAKVDDVADAQCVNVSQLRFGRLAGCGYPVIEPTPIVDGFRVGHHSLVFGFGEWIPAGNAADRRGQFATDVEPAFPECIESLRRCLAGQACKLFKFGLFHAHFMARRVADLKLLAPQ